MLWKKNPMIYRCVLINPVSSIGQNDNIFEFYKIGSSCRQIIASGCLLMLIVYIIATKNPQHIWLLHIEIAKHGVVASLNFCVNTKNIIVR